MGWGLNGIKRQHELRPAPSLSLLPDSDAVWPAAPSCPRGLHSKPYLKQSLPLLSCICQVFCHSNKKSNKERQSKNKHFTQAEIRHPGTRQVMLYLAAREEQGAKHSHRRIQPLLLSKDESACKLQARQWMVCLVCLWCLLWKTNWKAAQNPHSWTHPAIWHFVSLAPTNPWQHETCQTTGRTWPPPPRTGEGLSGWGYMV